MTDAGAGDARLTVLLDLRHPLAYLALHPTQALGRELRVAIDWLPFEVPTLSPPTPPGPDDDRSVRHRRHRAHAIAREVEAYGAAQGLVLRDIHRGGDPSAAHRAWLWVRERAPDALASFLSLAFRDYWSKALDPSDPEAVALRVDAMGADGAGFLDWCERSGSGALASTLSGLRDRGLHNVPAFLIEDEVFYGRQHLPMLRWILLGRKGPGPI